jgi:hypothetical protein
MPFLRQEVDRLEFLLAIVMLRSRMRLFLARVGRKLQLSS